MSDSAVAAHQSRPAWLPIWSVPAAIRAARATIVVPALFAVADKLIGNPQLTLFAVFGGFASLILASFGGSRRDKAFSHLGLALVGSAALVIGTLVSGTAWLAALVTIPVAFAIFFAGVTGPNAASGVTAALLAYVLPVATAAPISQVGWRLAGWWLASAAATAAVLLVAPPPAERLRRDAAVLARALATQLSSAVDGAVTDAEREASAAARHQLRSEFSRTPLRPTGLATSDQGLANVVELLDWCATLVSDTVDGHRDLSQAAPADQTLLRQTAQMLTTLAGLLTDRDTEADLELLEDARRASAAHQRKLTGDPERLRLLAAHAAHAQAIAVAVRATMADALIAARRASPELVAAERRRWFGQQDDPGTTRRLPATVAVAGFVGRHASLRSVWFLNSLRGAVALAVAVAVADGIGLQHGFWVVLGTLSVLRTSAAATGATAVRALAGTVVGFVVGAALLLGIGTEPTALWIALPCAVLIAAYAPGTAPFAVGQAAFTVTVVVIFNLLVPAGWEVGLLRVEDVAIGCAVSVLVGLLFWPRGASGVVRADLADAFRRGGSYLSQAVDFALSLRPAPPDTGAAAVTAGIRLDEALRAYLAEQGSKRLAKVDLWGLAMGSTRLRLTAYSVASLHDLDGHLTPAGAMLPADGTSPANGGPPVNEEHPADGARPAGARAQAGTPPPGWLVPGDPARSGFRHLTTDLVGFYDQIADQLSGPAGAGRTPVLAPALTGPTLPEGVACANSTPPQYQPDMLWVGEYLYHLGAAAGAVADPAAKVAMLRQRPWWR
ncbi:MAG TPA: FUSC family protein [Streptosporangiaceae bacterium]|jgi:uncharacterized membrane protein YccC